MAITKFLQLTLREEKSMSQAEVVMRVRFKSNLTLEQIKEIVETRAPEFQAITSLKQKYYLQDIATGEYAGLFIWETLHDFEEYRESELRATTAKAYKAQGQPNIDVYKVLKVLRDEND
jgi:heme-degrading monooxygenase HmoA